jgi:hypothetical protein
MAKKTKVKYKPGDWFRHEDGGIYILATPMEDVMTLICMDDGNRFRNPVDTKSHLVATDKEFRELSGEQFEPITKPMEIVRFNNREVR